jgi:hypothetical protein
MGNNNHIVVNQKLCGFQGCVRERLVVIEPVMSPQKFRSFTSQFFSQASQNITVKVRVHRSLRWNKFIDEFSKFVNIVCRFDGAWSLWTFIFNSYSTGLET